MPNYTPRFSIGAPRLPILAAVGTTAIAAMAFPVAAQAQQSADVDSGVYVTGRIGASLPSDFNLEGVQDPQAPSPGAAGAPANVDANLDSEVAFSGAIGYKLPTRIFNLFEPSIELEYSRTENDVSGGSFNGGNQTFGGEVEVQTFTVNYQSDIVWDDNQRVIPFIGGGIGIADVDSNVTYFPAAETSPTFVVTGSDTAFTLQSNAGVRFELTQNVSLDARVRYQQVNGIDLERRFIAGGNDAFNADVSGDYDSVNVLAGVRFSF
jgi:opacity protein-like surface antigen